MPTGYTADVQSGKITEFRDFAMQCARAFGALITMRDEPSDAPIPEEFKPSSHHADFLQRARDTLYALQMLTPEEVSASAKAANEKALKDWTDRIKENAAQLARYEAMLLQVEAWQPPSPDHVEMKSFMIKQLRDSIDFDCRYDWPKPKPLTPNEWLSAALAKARWEVEYHEKGDREERERTEGRNRWVRQLRESLAKEGGAS